MRLESAPPTSCQNKAMNQAKMRSHSAQQGGGAASIPVKFEEVTYRSVSLVSTVSKDELYV